MAEIEPEELQCPWCLEGLGIVEVPEDGSAIECPTCHERFYPEATSQDGAVEKAGSPPQGESDLDSYLDRKVRGSIPQPRDRRHLPTKSGDTTEGWSKWEHAAPKAKDPEFNRDLRKADEAGKLPEPMIQDLAHEKKVAPKFSEIGRTHLPEERAIDAEQRRRRDVLQKGWEAVADPTVPVKGPTISKKDALKFERNLVSTEERHSGPEEIEVKRHHVASKEDRLSWEDSESEDHDPGDFTVEGMEKAQRIRALFIGLLGACAILAAAVGLFVLFARMKGETTTTTLANDPAAGKVITDFSVSSNYNTIISRLRAFLEAEDIDTMLTTIRNREAVEPLVREYYKTHPYSRRLLREVPSQNSVIIMEGFAVVTCVVGKDEVLWVPMEIAAGLKVDWESVVNYSDMEWEEFARKRPKTPTLFRASIQPVNYYNYGFTDKDFISIQVSDPKLNHVFYGYIPRSGTLADEFVQLLPEAVGIGRARDLRAVVELRFPDGEAAANQVEIVSLKARGWVYRRDLRATTQSLELFANEAQIDGGGADLNNALHITDWDDTSTTLEWRVDIERPVQASVFATLANGGRPGKQLSLSAGPQRITHVVPVTGGWDEFREVFIGDLDFPSPGNYTLRLKHAKPFSGEVLMILDKLVFRAGNDLVGSRVRDPVLKPLVHAISMLSDLRRPGNTLTGPKRGAGWRMLFNGKNLDGWTGYRKKSAPAGWSAQANQLILVEPGCGPLMTTEDFENFELKLEWQTSDGQASGVFFRVAETKNTVEETAIEIELNGYGYSTLSKQETTPLTVNGAVKHLYQPRKFTLSESGWNELRVRLMNSEFQYWINGEEMGAIDRFEIPRPIDLQSEEWNRRVNESRMRRFQRFAKYSKGYIALEDAGTPARFRNIKVLVLGKEEYK